MKRIEVLAALVNAFGDAPDEQNAETTLLEVLNVLAVAGVEGAREHADAERAALTVRTAVRAREGEIIPYEEAIANAPNRDARRALASRGQCAAEASGAIVGTMRAVRCELPRGHATAGVKNNAEHAARVGGEWVRW